MRFISFSVEGMPSYGIATTRGVHDLGARIGDVLPDLKAYLEAQAAGVLAPLKQPKETDYKLSEIEFDPLIANPNKILCVGLNYEEHRVETGNQKAGHPAIFTRYADSLVGHKGEMILPACSTKFDFEAELAIVIGQHCRKVPREHALEVVAGFTCFNDGSIRDWQRHNTQFTPGKTFPGTGPLGPEMVTPDELGDFSDNKIQLKLNGAVMQSSTLGHMIFSVEEIIAYISAFTPLAPGDIIATGTPGGVGARREPPVFMKAGDKVEVIIDGVGHLVNVVADEDEDA